MIWNTWHYITAAQFCQSTALFHFIFYLFCVGCIICSLTSRAQPIFIHWIFAAFQFIFLFFLALFFTFVCNYLESCVAKPHWYGIFRKQRCKKNVLHDSVPWYYLGELRVLHTIRSSISIYYVLQYSNLFANAKMYLCMVAKILYPYMHTDWQSGSQAGWLAYNLTESNFWPKTWCPHFVFHTFPCINCERDAF